VDCGPPHTRARVSACGGVGRVWPGRSPPRAAVAIKARWTAAPLVRRHLSARNVAVAPLETLGLPDGALQAPWRLVPSAQASPRTTHCRRAMSLPTVYALLHLAPLQGADSTTLPHPWLSKNLTIIGCSLPSRCVAACSPAHHVRWQAWHAPLALSRS